MQVSQDQLRVAGKAPLLWSLPEDAYQQVNPSWFTHPLPPCHMPVFGWVRLSPGWAGGRLTQTGPMWPSVPGQGPRGAAHRARFFSPVHMCCGMVG